MIFAFSGSFSPSKTFEEDVLLGGGTQLVTSKRDSFPVN